MASNSAPNSQAAGTKKRIEVALRRLDLYSPERAMAVEILLDMNAESPMVSMARLGFKWGDGAPNKKLLDEVARRLGRSALDREARDQVQLPLREAGILSKATAEPNEGRFIAHYWKPKSNYCCSVVSEEFKDLLDLPDKTFGIQLDIWLEDTPLRLTRVKAAEARAWAAEEEGRLVPLTINTYCADLLKDYEIIFVDDQDGPRIGEAYKAGVQKFGIPLNLSSRWPDIILRNSGTGAIWIVDAVESDGEVDTERYSEMVQSFTNAGLQVDGFTTAYRTLQKFLERQRKHDNVALDTFVWILEIGGTHWRKTRSLF